MFYRISLIIITALSVSSLAKAQQAPTFEHVSTYLAGGFDESAAEIVA